MTDFDKKWLRKFVIVEVLAFLGAKLLKLVLNLLPDVTNKLIGEGLDILKGLIIPLALIITALILLGLYKNDRDGGGTI